jgi:hypothetical protein
MAEPGKPDSQEASLATVNAVRNAWQQEGITVP